MIHLHVLVPEKKMKKLGSSSKVRTRTVTYYTSSPNNTRNASRYPQLFHSFGKIHIHIQTHTDTYIYICVCVYGRFSSLPASLPLLPLHLIRLLLVSFLCLLSNSLLHFLQYNLSCKVPLFFYFKKKRTGTSST